MFYTACRETNPSNADPARLSKEERKQTVATSAQARQING